MLCTVSSSSSGIAASLHAILCMIASRVNVVSITFGHLVVTTFIKSNNVAVCLRYCMCNTFFELGIFVRGDKKWKTFCFVAIVFD